MNSALRLRLMTRGDLPFADSVRSIEGWNQTLADWERFLALQPEGCFVAEWNAAAAGTAATTIYGADLAWIGMVLVHPDYRRRGIGSALLKKCIEYLQARGVRCIKLDATPLGQKVYEGLGFKTEWMLTRWQRYKSDGAPSGIDPGIRSVRPEDLDQIDGLDRSAFGVSRGTILKALAKQSLCTLALESEPGNLAGHGMLRKGAQAFYLGPVVARSAQVALPLVEALLERAPGQKIFWDIPDQNAAAGAWAREHGFAPQRSLTRMYLGENSTPGDPRKQIAIAGPAIG